jgi:hypothetical protein
MRYTALHKTNSVNTLLLWCTSGCYYSVLTCCTGVCKLVLLLLINSLNISLAHAAMRGTRPGTSRPVTALGREVRLGTASMAAAAESGSGVFINSDRLDLRKYARRPAMAMVSSSGYRHECYFVEAVGAIAAVVHT